MNNDSRYTILVLRGGSKDHALSITTGAELGQAFVRTGTSLRDIYVDAAGVWHKAGMPVDQAPLFSEVDAYVDLTGSHDDAPYHGIAKKMGVKRLFYKEGNTLHEDRETLYRILRQQGILTPETYTVRSVGEDVSNTVHDIWRKMMTPLFVRDTRGLSEGSVVASPFELSRALLERQKSAPLHVMPFRAHKSRSIVILPSYRGEELYVPLPVETRTDKKHEAPRRIHQMLPLHYLSRSEKDALANFARGVYRALDAEGVLLLDVIETKKGYMVTHASERPSLLKGGRFDEVLATTGVDLAHYGIALLDRHFHDRKG